MCTHRRLECSLLPLIYDASTDLQDRDPQLPIARTTKQNVRIISLQAMCFSLTQDVAFHTTLKNIVKVLAQFTLDATFTSLKEP